MQHLTLQLAGRRRDTWLPHHCRTVHQVGQSEPNTAEFQHHLSAHVDGRTVQCRTFLSRAGEATPPLSRGRREENIPERSKGKHCASCHPGVGWDWRGVKRKRSLEVENERDVI